MKKSFIRPSLFERLLCLIGRHNHVDIFEGGYTEDGLFEMKFSSGCRRCSFERLVRVEKRPPIFDPVMLRAGRILGVPILDEEVSRKIDEFLTGSKR